MFHIPFLDIPPLLSADGEVRLPGSKSISNRVLLLAALCKGETLVHDVLDSDDTQVMLKALRQLGCGVDVLPNHQVRIVGLGGQLPVHQADLFLGNAGTAMRPMTAALALLSALHGGQFSLSGIARMHERPIGDLVQALQQLGCPVVYEGQVGYPPLRIAATQPVVLNLSEPVRVRGDVSSQFLTALLLALPLVAHQQDIVIKVDGELISRPYIDLTLNLLAQFGVLIAQPDAQTFVIPQGSTYQSPGHVYVEADASSASYFIALGALACTDNQAITVRGVGLQSIQGDIRFVDAAQAMGTHIEGGPNWLKISRGTWPLKAIDINANHIPDAAMTLAIMALYADGVTTITHIGSWRVKETDRIDAMTCELRKLGAQVEQGADWIRITPPATPADWRAASIHTYDDHRMAMCFSLAAFNPASLPVRIQDPKCVAKTFPQYFEQWFDVVQAKPDAIPVICIDGPTASGKGTLAAEVAAALGYHVLDSGLLYRLVGLVALRAGLNISKTSVQQPEQAQTLTDMAYALKVQFKAGRVSLQGQDVTDDLRQETVGMAASCVSAVGTVRQALLEVQRSFRQLPGLVADGRDMGTVIFPDASLKIYLTATAEQRAERRCLQLQQRGQTVIIADLLQALRDRDWQDQNRQHAPLKPAQDARLLDNSHQTIDQSVALVLDGWASVQPFDR
jgi:3-phosphoshikimate 1-carboxyvinyltransferase